MVIVLFAAIFFTLVTVVNESIIYVIITVMAIAVAWGIWQAR